MKDKNHNRNASSLAAQIFAGEGEMAELMRARDWSESELGPLECWPESLKSTLSICLNSRFPFALYWGPDFNLLYNDAWRPIPGDKHPQSLGRKAREVWPEIWDTIGPMFQSVRETGKGVWSEDSLLPMHRFGYLEECYFSFNVSPARGKDGTVDGLVNIVIETTYRVINERRTQLLRALAARIASAKSDAEVCRLAAESMAGSPADIPFSLLYLVDREKRKALRAGVSGLSPKHPACPAEIKLAPDGGDACPWPAAAVAHTAQPQRIDDLVAKIGEILGGAWPEPVREAWAFPITAAAQGGVVGVLVVGISPRRVLDDNYRAFFDLLAGHLATAIANARAYEEERMRAEALAEIDRAKTEFFANISHEFRTPLTLMLGPTEDLLAGRAGAIPDAIRSELEVMQRNAVRLLRLVNALLDFSRIEAGRIQATFEPTDLSAFTTDLASSFRSLVERAGIKLIVDCPQMPEPIYVDRAHWEKIVLNLLSNAFKFTFQGAIAVSLSWREDHVELTVRDTGTGIPETEIQRIFERFHRIQGVRGRSFEGTGIGLALVQELVQLHGGSVRVSSVEGQGSTFVVSMPVGTAHLPTERITTGRELAAATSGATPYILEASQWLPSSGEKPDKREMQIEDVAPRLQEAEAAPTGGRLLIADDNADMREYLVRLLTPHWNVEAVEDGEAALASARTRPPELVLSDVMMPRLDGFGLLRALRSDARTRSIPIILLSARAGEASAVEGLDAGADDYLVKPFSARELLARVRTHLDLARVRRAWASDLERANAELDAFSYSVSHDLRAPLRAIDGFSKALLTEYGEKFDDQGRHYLQRVRTSTQRMAALIDDLLNLSRVNRAPLRWETISLTTLAASVVTELRRREPARQVAIEITEGLVARGDGHLVTVVLDNLLGNAWKFTAQRPNARIVLGQEKRGDQMVFSVRDNGAGFDMSYADKLFAPFQRLHRESEFAGTGIGLATVHRIIARHGGRIWAEAAVHKGATFFFTLGESQ